MVTGGECESAGEALGGIRRRRHDRPSVAGRGGGAGAPFFFWMKERLEEKKGDPEVS